MNEVLSREEIDALLRNVGSAAGPAAETREGSVSPYDFRRPDKFSKDLLRNVQVISETFARLVSTSLSAFLRTTVHLAVTSVDQLSFNEFMGSLPSPTVLTVFSVAPVDGSAIFEVNPVVAFSIIDRLLGGAGTAPRRPRELTEIERSLVEAVVGRVLVEFVEAWRDVMVFEPEIQTMESDPQFVQIAAPSQTVILISFDTAVGSSSGMVSLCLPDIVLEAASGKMSLRQRFGRGPRHTDAKCAADLQVALEETRLPVVAVLGRTSVTFGELLCLEPGDVVKIGTRVDEDLAIVIGERQRLRGRPGLLGRSLAVQITGTT